MSVDNTYRQVGLSTTQKLSTVMSLAIASCPWSLAIAMPDQRAGIDLMKKLEELFPIKQQDTKSDALKLFSCLMMKVPTNREQ